MTEKRVLISGASIAGPTLAFWLERYGWMPTVVERAPELRMGGQNIDIRGAGRTVVRRMGLEDAVREATTGEEGTQFIDHRGRVVASTAASQSDTSGATAELEILRGDLAQLLTGATDSTTEYIFGDSITAIVHNRDDVTVSFEHGPDRTVDLVVIAEGMNSRTRDLVLPGARIRRLGVATAYLTIPRISSDTGWARWYNATGGRTLLLRPDNKGTARASLSFLTDNPRAATTASAAGSPSGDSRDLVERDPDAQKRLLRAVFRDAGWQVPRVLDALDKSADMYFEHIGQVMTPHWSSDRTVLVGDAAYCASPISGMGTSLALVGAYVLAGELAAHVDHGDAFRGYERIMRPYVRQAQHLPPGAPRLANPKSRVGIGLFHAALKVGTSRAFSALGDRFFSPPADRIDLPDYSHLERDRA